MCVFLALGGLTHACSSSGPEHKVELDHEFEPNLLNSAVYLLSLSMQVSTFWVNYQGRPFRESLSENRPLRNALGAVFGVAFYAAMEMNADFNEWLQLVPFPASVCLVSLCSYDRGLIEVPVVVSGSLGDDHGRGFRWMFRRGMAHKGPLFQQQAKENIAIGAPQQRP